MKTNRRRMMNRKLVVGGIAVLMVSLAIPGLALAEDWGHSGATPGPVKDDTRSGYWWWPTEKAAGTSDDGLWGNRGRIFGQYQVSAPPAPRKVVVAPPPPPPLPPPPPPVEVKRTAPVFNETLFGFDSSTLSESGKSSLERLASYLEEHSGDTLEIQGHTCDVNNSGDPDYNKKLGLRRAESVMEALADFGVADQRLSAASYGESDPAVPNSSSENRTMNRRVVFVLDVSDE